jgi:hypothetical protein
MDSASAISPAFDAEYPIDSGRPAIGRERADHHDVPVIAFDHRLDHPPDHPRRAGQVHVEHLFHPLGVPVLRLQKRGEPGEEHDAVDLAHLGHRRRDAVAVGDVDRDMARTARQLGDDLLQLVLGPGRHDHLGPARLSLWASAAQPFGRADQPVPFSAPLSHGSSSFQAVAGCGAGRA